MSSKQCLGNGRCVVGYKPEVTYSAPSSLDPAKTWTIVHDVASGDSPITTNLTIQGTSASYRNGTTETPDKGAVLTATVTPVYRAVQTRRSSQLGRARGRTLDWMRGRGARARWSIDVQPDPLGMHSWSILCGLSLLRDQGEIVLRYRDVGAPAEPGTWLRVRDERTAVTRTIYIDTADGAAPGGPERTVIADDVWKRSWMPGQPGRPLGLVASIRSGHEQLARYVAAAAWTAGKPRRFTEVRRVASFVRRRTLPAVVDDYERDSRVEPVVLFQVRAWAPGETRLAETRDTVNDGRAAVIEALQRQFGGRFRGGFLPTDFARDHYPGLVTDRPVGRAEYAALIRSSAVGVSTVGLHGSNPWKLAEYLAGGVAVVSEPLRYALPEPLEPACWFESPQECVTACDALLSGGAWVEAGARSRMFWQEFVRPDQLLMRRLVEEFG